MPAAVQQREIRNRRSTGVRQHCRCHPGGRVDLGGQHCHDHRADDEDHLVVDGLDRYLEPEGWAGL